MREWLLKENPEEEWTESVGLSQGSGQLSPLFLNSCPLGKRYIKCALACYEVNGLLCLAIKPLGFFKFYLCSYKAKKAWNCS